MRLNKPLVLQCKKCGEIIEAEMDLQSVFLHERQMGYETQFQGEVEAMCPFCNNFIYILLEAWEYPIGALNYINVEGNGVELIESPDLVCDDIF